MAALWGDILLILAIIHRFNKRRIKMDMRLDAEENFPLTCLI